MILNILWTFIKLNINILLSFEIKYNLKMDIFSALNSLNCQLQNHCAGQILGFCIDKNCKEKNKFAFSECIFDVHSLHKLVKIKELNNLIQTKYKVYKQNLEEEKKIIEVYKASELESVEKIEKLKKDVINEIENKTNNFIKELKNKYN